MVMTYGLTHIALTVQNAERSLRFYQQVFGVVEVYREGAGFIQAQTPGSRDVLVFVEESGHIGKSGGIMHFGFRLTAASDIDAAVHAVEDAGGTLLSQGEFSAGEPYLFFNDPDDYEVEIWFEPPTAVDPTR